MDGATERIRIADLLITSEFLRRARAEAVRRKLDLQSGLVQYVDRSTYRGPMGFFRKFSSFSYQSECRLVLLPGTVKPYSLRVGDLSDIALIGELAQLSKRMRVTPEDAAQQAPATDPIPIIP